jgi:peptide/nickel transport system substrate-binding protein
MKTRSLILVLVLITMLAASSVANAQDGTKIPRGGVVVVSEGRQAPFVSNFNPYAPDPTPWAQAGVYEPLMIPNAPNGFELIPWLATGFSYSEDLLTLTFTLQEGVKWNDGEDFNADDVVFTFELFQKFPALDRKATLNYFTSVEKVDDYTVAIHLTEVYTLAHYLFSSVWPLPEHAWSTIEDPVTYTNDTPVATGPLATVKVVNEQVLELCRNETYWQMGEDGLPLPYVDCMRQPVYPGNDPANLATVNGEVDWVANFIPDIESTFIAANPEKHHYYFWPGGGVVSLYYNTEKAPYSDLAFRQALSMAIDYESVTSIGMYGYTNPSEAILLSDAFKGSWNQAAIDKAAELGIHQYDPDAAEAALDAAGYVDADGDGWRDLPDGSDLSFKVQVVNGWTDWVTSVQIMSQNFQDIGLNASIDVLDFGIWLNNLQTGTYDTSIGWGTGDPTAWDVFRNLLYSDLIGDDGMANAQLWSRWTSPEADQLLEEYVATTDAAAQKAAMDQIQMIFVENLPLIPLFPGPTWYEWTDYRFTGFPTQEDYYIQGSSWTTNGQRLVVLMKLHCISDETCAEAQ